MGCKCANSGEEEEDEIKINDQTEGFINLTDQKSDQYSPYINDIKNKSIFKNTLDKTNNNNSGQKSNGIFAHEENTPQNSSNQNNKYKEDKYLNSANFAEKIVELINSIRQDPPSYADYVEDSIQNIIDDNNKNDKSKTKIIYKQKKIKVALTRGKPAFLEAAEELRNTGPLPPLEFVSSLCISLPDSEEEIHNSSILKRKVKELREQGIEINVFFKDLIKNPEISVLLMIVDDSNKYAGKKRMALLNKDFRYIGVNCKFIGKTFIAYLAFS